MFPSASAIFHLPVFLSNTGAYFPFITFSKSCCLNSSSACATLLASVKDKTTGKYILVDTKTGEPHPNGKTYTTSVSAKKDLGSSSLVSRTAKGAFGLAKGAIKLGAKGIVGGVKLGAKGIKSVRGIAKEAKELTGQAYDEAVERFNDAEKASYYSNEVRFMDREQIMVKCKRKLVAKGLYESVIDNKNCRGAKYCKSVYVAYKGADGKLEICNVQMVGSAVSAWIDFRNKNKSLNGYGVSVQSAVQKTKGATTYYEPVFRLTKALDKAILDQAVELDKQLQTYLKAYFSLKSQEVNDSIVQETVAEAQPTPAPKSESAAPSPVPEVIGGDDLPF